MSWERMTRLASSPFTRTAAEVSSHDVSIPRTASATTGGRPAAPQRDRVGNGAGGDAARRDDGDPRHAAARSRDVRNDSQGIARNSLHALFGAADVDRHARRRDDEARDRAAAALDRNSAERTLRDAAHVARHGHLLRREPHDAEGHRIDRHVARELARHVRDLHRYGRHGIDRGETLFGADEPYRGWRHRET